MKRRAKSVRGVREKIGSRKVFTAVIFQVEVFSVVMPCNVTVAYQRFRGPCCLRFQDEVDVGILPRHYTASQPRRRRLEREDFFFFNFCNRSRPRA
jgi:hypothetical protein